MELDPRKMKDWEIAAQAEKEMKPITQIAEDFGIHEEELLPYGHFLGKIDYRKVLDRLGDVPDGKYIDVTAITPTPLGEGKTTTTIGLVEGLSYAGKKVSGAIRQPSEGRHSTSRDPQPGEVWPSAFPLRTSLSDSPVI